MKESCFSSNRYLALVVMPLVSALLLVGGCYEGWERKKKDSPQKGSAPKRFVYILIEHFQLSDDALKDAACFSGGTEDYRKTEWKMRLDGIAKAARELAETVQVRTRSIDINDCNTLSTIETAAVDDLPWGDNAPNFDIEEKRLTIHLKVWFWDSDVAQTPSSDVTAVNWRAWKDMQMEGWQVKSLHYAVLSNSSNGYLSQWADSLPSANLLQGTPIDQVDPSQQGTNVRNQVIAKDNSEFKKWLSSK